MKRHNHVAVPLRAARVLLTALCLLVSMVVVSQPSAIYNYSNLARRFRELYGCSPVEYRKQNRL